MNTKIALYNKPTPGITSYYEMIDLAAEWGISNIEAFARFELNEPNEQAAEELRNYADEKKIRFCCFSLFVNLVGEDRAEQIQRVKQFARIAQILGSPYLHHTIVNALRDPEGVLRQQETYFERGLQAVREIYDAAENIGIRPIYEDQGYLFNGLENFKRFLKEVKRDVGVVADVGNIAQVGESIEPFIRAFSSQICHVHLKDVAISREPGGYPTLDGRFMQEREPGKGCVNIREAVRLLKESGYTGCYSLEYGAPTEDPTPLRNALDLIENLLKS